MVRCSTLDDAAARGMDARDAAEGADGPDDEVGLRVMLIGDQPLFRDGVRMALQGADGLRVIAEASNRDEVVELLARQRIGADVILVDLQMADASGVDITKRIGERFAGGPRVIAIGAGPDDESVVAVLRAGARGYLLKNVAARELVWAIRIVAAGGAVFSPPVAERLGAYFSAVHGVPARAAFPELTNREREILDLIARGLDNQRIASTLVLSNKTVRNHITSLFAKLRVTDRVAAAVRARDAGLG
ncbi:response regulator transcription factor [Streptomyces sp. NPDC046887]|uniref:response regulator transcription factor n=1 Tax=Streptomyces sp. NPDC046887 TaxID=3155472 RepID=UPI0033D079D4